jgi:hypothetical protein
MKKFHFTLLLLFTTFLLVGLFVLGHLDDARGQRSLLIVSPLVSFASDCGLYLIQNMRQLLVWATLSTAGLFLLCMIQRRSLSFAVFLLGIIGALLTQFVLIDETARLAIGRLFGFTQTPELSTTIAIGAGVVGYTVSLLLLVASWRGPYVPRFEELQSSASRYPWLDFVILVVIVIVGALFRTYALNQHMNYFEGELSPYSAGATSLSGMFYANRGHNGPWAPLGLLYYLPIYITTSLWGVNLLALRESSALVGVLTIPLIFLLANKVAGRVAGLVAAALFSLNCLHIGWSRTDIHPHGVTTWPTLLMCFFLLKAAETGKLSWAFATACMMGLSWHQYPSGQSAVAIPLIAIAFSFVFNRGSLPLRRIQVAILVLGVALWFVGLPLSYYPAGGQFRFFNPFTLTGPRALWGADGLTPNRYEAALFVAVKATKHFWDFAQGVFFKVPYLFHQEWLPSIPPLQMRSVPWFAVVLSITAVAILLAQRKRFESAVLFGWFVAAVLPGILSEHAYPKRLSTTFPLFDVLAGVGGGFLLAYSKRLSLGVVRFAMVLLFVLTLTAYSLYSAYYWFSGRYFPYGSAPELAIARELERTITPRTIVISGLGGGYEVGKFLYLMLDHLTDPANRPNMFLTVSNEWLLNLLAKPVLTREFLAGNLPYLWTKLDKQLEESLATKEWSKVTFLILERLHNNPMHERAIELATASCPNPTVQRISSSPNSYHWAAISIVSITCPVSEMVTPFTVG